MVFKHIKYLLFSIIVISSHDVYAVLIVDTGTPDGSVETLYGESQYFAGEFSVAGNYTINNIESYFQSENYGSASVSNVIDISIHSDAGNTPGATLFSTQIIFDPNLPLDWHGVGGLDWSINAGTYWVSFVPDTFVGIMPGIAPNPLDEYALGGFGTWLDSGADFYDSLALGFQIDATPTSAPEPSLLALLSIGLIAMGLVRIRK